MRLARQVTLVPGAGVEPARPCGQGILSPPRLPFRHPGDRTKRNDPGRGPESCRSAQLEATGGFEPPIRVLQTPALTTWLRRPVLLVPRRGFEPLRPYEHRPLKTACLPIPPPRQHSPYYRFWRRGGNIELSYASLWQSRCFQVIGLLPTGQRLPRRKGD